MYGAMSLDLREHREPLHSQGNRGSPHPELPAPPSCLHPRAAAGTLNVRPALLTQFQVHSTGLSTRALCRQQLRSTLVSVTETPRPLSRPCSPCSPGPPAPLGLTIPSSALAAFAPLPAHVSRRHVLQVSPRCD